MNRNTTAVVIILCICPLIWTPATRAAEPMLDCLPEPVEKSGEQLGSAALIVTNLGLGFFNANRQAGGKTPGSMALLGIAAGTGSVIYAAAGDPEFSMVMGISGALSAAMGMFCLANQVNGSADGRDGDRWSARVGPAVIVPAKGKALVGLGLSGGF